MRVCPVCVLSNHMMRSRPCATTTNSMSTFRFHRSPRLSPSPFLVPLFDPPPLQVPARLASDPLMTSLPSSPSLADTTGARHIDKRQARVVHSDSPSGPFVEAVLCGRRILLPQGHFSLVSYVSCYHPSPFSLLSHSPAFTPSP